MSAIDTVWNELIGEISGISIYRLKEDVPKNMGDFDGKKGDVLLGGGGGEAAAMRISIPEAITFYTHDIFTNNLNFEDVVKYFWSTCNTYNFYKTYMKIGYRPSSCPPLEYWLTEHIISYLLKNFQEDYSKYAGKVKLQYNGKIVQQPDPDMLAWNIHWWEKIIENRNNKYLNKNKGR